MDQCRWPRADEHETGHKVPSFVEVDRCQTPSRSPGMQAEMGHPETNSWDFWPTGSSKPTPRPWGGWINQCRATSSREKTWACLHVQLTNFSFCPFCGWVSFLFPPVVCLFFLLSFIPSSATMAHSSSHARTVPERSRSRDDHMWQRPQTQHRGRTYDPNPQQLQHLNFGKYWWLWISSQSVHSWPRFIVTSWNQQHVRSHHLWIGWRNEPCSPTMYFSILIALHPSRCTTFFIASASTSGTRGITTCLLRPWTLDGKMRPAIHSLVETNFDLLTFYMTFDLTGSKVKIAACFFWMIPAHLGLTWSLSSCAWVAMRPCPIATCFLKLEKFLAFRVLELSFLVLASLLLLTCSII